MQTWSRIDSLFGILEEAIRPEVNPKDLFQLANEYFRWERFIILVTASDRELPIDGLPPSLKL